MSQPSIAREGVPIVAHHEPVVSPGRTDRALAVAEALLREQPGLAIHSTFGPLVPSRLGGGASLVLDDLSAISSLGHVASNVRLEDRARLRAMDGDLVASCTPASPTFERYCEDRLQLGSTRWLRPRPRGRPDGVASACWNDLHTRRALLYLLRRGGFDYVHPHISSFPVWAMALLFRRKASRPLSVIGPPPRLCQAANDKTWFTEVVRRIFGDRWVPPSAVAWNLSTLAHLVAHFARQARRVVVKVPDSAGGSGNLVLDAARLRPYSLGLVRRFLRHRLGDIGASGATHYLVSAWETEVLSAPSAQLWIPPEDEGDPILEGVFEQVIEGERGEFVGSRFSRLPADLTEEIASRSWLLGRAFQRLGWIGRCSFDTLLVGQDLGGAAVEFLECNGRWGGTSVPMTLMNRLFGDCASVPYATHDCELDGLRALHFEDLLELFADDLYDARTGEGSLIFYNPAGLEANETISLLAIASTWSQASEIAEREVPERIRASLAR